MSDNVPSKPSHCTLPWCAADHHQRNPVTHAQPTADIAPEGSTVELWYASDQPDGSQPYILANYGVDWKRWDELAIPFTAATALADLLQLLDERTLREFVAALRHTMAGPHSGPKRTKW